MPSAPKQLVPVSPHRNHNSNGVHNVRPRPAARPFIIAQFRDRAAVSLTVAASILRKEACVRAMTCLHARIYLSFQDR